MSLDIVNDLFNNLKENKFVQNFIKELSNYLEKKGTNNQEISEANDNWCNLLEDNLEINNKKLTSKYKNEMLIERANILQNYAQNTKDEGEMYYIYNMNDKDKDTYNLCICDTSKSHEVITKKLEELPSDSKLGSVLRKQDENFILDKNATQTIQKQINNMIQEKIREQDQYLDSKRIEGHVYEVDEKNSGRIWLYDLNNKIGEKLDEIEEIEFPQSLYETAKKGDLFIYQKGEYQKYETSTRIDN